jgi:membrane-bound lytic murein transglycosylase D
VASDVETPVPLDEIASDARLPVEVNDRVTYWMRRFVGDQRPTFEQFLVRQGLYGDMIQGKLRARGMPEDLLYLAMIESGFRPMARSKVEATGVWQFMGPTARQYGLRIDEYVDERRDPVRATDAALDYLETLHARFGSWYLAAAAYNAGPNRVARVLRDHAEARTGDEELYWEIIEHLPWETRHYVPRLIAATLLAKRADDLGFAAERDLPYAYDRVWVPGNTRLGNVAKELGVAVSLLRDLNPHLIRGVTPPGGSHELRVPSGQSQTVVAALNGGDSRHLADD